MAELFYGNKLVLFFPKFEFDTLDKVTGKALTPAGDLSNVFRVYAKALSSCFHTLSMLGIYF